jgi:hypothetical protein
LPNLVKLTVIVGRTYSIPFATPDARFGRDGVGLSWTRGIRLIMCSRPLFVKRLMPTSSVIPLSVLGIAKDVVCFIQQLHHFGRSRVVVAVGMVFECQALERRFNYFRFCVSGYL